MIKVIDYGDGQFKVVVNGQEFLATEETINIIAYFGQKLVFERKAAFRAVGMDGFLLVPINS